MRSTPADTSSSLSPEWWTIRELAERWRCSPDTIMRMVGGSTLRAMKLGGSWRIHRTAIESHERAALSPDVQREARPRKSRQPALPDLIGEL